jgi:23S rRNA pseudouridine955/2504/2580 synthase
VTEVGNVHSVTLPAPQNGASGAGKHRPYFPAAACRFSAPAGEENVPSRTQDEAILPQNQSTVRYLQITDRDAGQRVDNFLLRVLKGVPRSHVYRLLRSGQVRVNKGRVKPDRRLENGDQVRLPPYRGVEPRKPPRAPDALVERVLACVLSEDEDFLALNKPAGLPVHGGSGVAFGLIEVLRQARGADEFLELGHRLDRETSGCLLVAKNRQALVALHQALREGTAVKTYQAMVVGRWERGMREVTDPLQKNVVQGGERRVVADPEGKEARSQFSPKGVFSAEGREVTLMEVRIFTGRMHQIRVHAAQLGHPVVMDDKYGSRETNHALRKHGLRRMFLHAQSLKVELPLLQRTLQWSADLPADLREFMSSLTLLKA